jgi:hypothetical protein
MHMLRENPEDRDETPTDGQYPEMNKNISMAGVPVKPINESLVAFYRCPANFPNFNLAGELASERGYFSFGKSTTCFGRSSVGSLAMAAGNGLRDLSRLAKSDCSTVYLPFNPTEIIDNLRLERYATNGYAGHRSILSSRAIRRAYYSVRPILPISVRKHLQKLALGNWHELAFPAWPVDTSVEHILERLLILSLEAQGMEKTPFIWFWPEGASSCVLVTHDVETKQGLRFAPRLMDVDEEFEIRASFQVIPQNNYDLDPEFINTVRARGFELAIQDLNHDGNLFSSYEEFQLHARSINQYLQKYEVQGFRSGRMYRNADWLGALNIAYDMSVPNVAHLEPQRGGCCTVFPYFIGKVLELPLTTTQDYSLFHILGDYSIDLWKKQTALIMEKHGLVSFIAHPDYVMEAEPLKAYRALLDHISRLRKERDVWVALPREVNQWWRQRSQMILVPEGAGWRIEGPAHERARLAYASVQDGRVVYSVASSAKGES